MAFDTTVFLPLDTHAVFELVTQPERLRRWKTVAARIELEVGGEYRWTITPGHSAMGNILELVPGKKMVLSWGWEGWKIFHQVLLQFQYPWKASKVGQI